jgi:hypothetical protein
MAKLKCKLYAYKVTKLHSSITEKFLIEKFVEKKTQDNILKEIKGTYYGGSLIFKEKIESEGLAFSFTKILHRKQEFIRLKSKLFDKFSRIFYGNENEKPIHDSYFVYYPKDKLIIGLYNYEGLRHMIGDLQIYFEKFLGLPKDSCQFDMIQNTKKLSSLLKDVKYINRVIIKTALIRLDKDIEFEDENPFTKIETYRMRGYRILDFNHLKTLKEKAVDKLNDLINIHKSANSIFVTGDNINGDILGKLLLHKICYLKVDSNEKISLSDFLNNTKEFYNIIKKDIINYESD